MVSRADLPLSGLEIFLAAALLFLAIGFYGAHNVTLYLTWASALIAAVVYYFSKNLEPTISRVNIKVTLMLLAWVLFALLITPWVDDRVPHLKISSIVIAYTLFSVILINFLLSRVRLVGVLGRVFALWAVLEFLLLVVFVATGGSWSERFSGSYSNPNTLAVTASFIFLFLIVFRLYLNIKVKPLFWLVLLSLPVFVLLSGSTKGLLGIFLVAAGYAFIAFRRENKFIMLTVVSVLMAIALVVFSGASERLLSKLQVFTGEEFAPGHSGGQRVFLMKEGLRVISENPLTGVGVHNSQHHLFTLRYYILLERGEIPKGSTGVYSHNNFIEMGLNGGIIAFLLFYIPIFFVLWKTYRAKPPTRLLGRTRIFILLAIALKLFFDVGMVSYNSLIHIFILALCFVLYYRLLRPARYGVIWEGKI